MLAPITHPGLAQAYAYWDSKRRGRRMPARADLDPTEMPRLLPHLALLDIERSPLRFRYRLVGSHIDDVRREHGKNLLTGEYLDAARYDMASGATLHAVAAGVVESG